VSGLTWDGVRARRLRRCRLVDGLEAVTPAQAAAAVCAQQAQVLGAAEHGLALRAGVSREAVRRALWEERTLVKAWTLRGTLHLVPADELELWLAARRAVGDEPETPEDDEVAAAIADALDGRALSRSELADAVVERLGEHHREALASAWGAGLRPAARRGLLCTGPSRGTEVTFVRPDQWLGRPLAHPEPHAALRVVVRRFVHVYGPTRHDELCRFLGTRPPLARAALERLELEEVRLDGRRLLLAGDLDGLDEQPAGVRLLPQYDAYVIGFHPRDQLVPAGTKARIAEHGRGRYEGVVALRTVLVDGVVAGLWERQGGTVRVELHRRLDAARRHALRAEVDRLGVIEGSPLRLETGRLAF
jgi:hypothetical protein